MMKKTLLLSALALGLISSSANAFTAQGFADKGAFWEGIGATLNLTGTSNFVSHLNGDVNVATTDINGTTVLKVTNFLNSSLLPGSEDAYLYIKINGNSASIAANVFGPANNNSVYVQLSAAAGDLTPICVIPNEAYGIFAGTYQGKNVVYMLLPTNGPSTTSNKLANTWRGTCTELEDGNYRIEFGNFIVLRTVRTNGSFYLNNFAPTQNARKTTAYYYALDGYSNSSISSGAFVIQTYNKNATVKDTRYDYNGSSKTSKSEREYTASVVFNNNTFSIDNWGNMGRPYSVNLNNYTSTQQKFDGQFDNNNLTLTLKGKDIKGYNTVTQSTSGNSHKAYAVKMGNTFNQSTGAVTDIEGTLTGEPEHQASRMWLDGTKYKTVLKNVEIEFDDYILAAYNQSQSPRYEYQNYVENTVVKLNDDMEYTHDVKLIRNEYGYGKISDDNPDDYLYINCNLDDFKNSKFVESYELYIMPNVNIDAYFNNTEKGHALGQRIDLPEYVTDFNVDRTKAISANDEEESYTYNLLFPEKDIQHKSTTHDYKIYVKANYTEESGLAPSFHALTSLDEPTTGVESIIDNGTADEDAPAVYYNMNGVQVDGDNLTPGLYIRRQGNTATKVIIK